MADPWIATAIQITLGGIEVIVGDGIFLLGLPVLIAVAVLAWQRMRERSGAIPKVTIEISVPTGLYRSAQHPAFFYSVGALTGVSITFSPLALWWLGSSGARLLDWRVMTCVVVTYVVPGVYMRFGSLVMHHAWKSRNRGA